MKRIEVRLPSPLFNQFNKLCCDSGLPKTRALEAMVEAVVEGRVTLSVKADTGKFREELKE